MIPKVFPDKDKKVQFKVSFNNRSGYQIGQRINWKGKDYVVSAILRITDQIFAIYGIRQGQPFNYSKCCEEQMKREKGMLNIYLSGSKLFVAIV